MRKVIKVKYYLDKEDKKQIRKQLIDKDLRLVDCAKKLGVSLAYIDSIINGQRNLTKNIIEKFNVLGIKLDLEKE